MRTITSASVALNVVLACVLVGLVAVSHVARPALSYSPVAVRGQTIRAPITTCAKKDMDIDTNRISRRSISGALGAVGAAVPFLASRQAMALIQDDDDPELVAKAKANRAARLKEERQVEDEFLRAQGVTNKRERIELMPITRAVSRLADLGQNINDKDFLAISVSLSDGGGTGGWISPLMDKIGQLSETDATKASMGQLKTALDSMSAAAKSKDLNGVKRSYVTSVSAFEQWAVDADVAKFLRAQ